jgi:hypothetical protein
MEVNPERIIPPADKCLRWEIEIGHIWDKLSLVTSHTSKDKAADCYEDFVADLLALAEEVKGWKL